MIYIDFEICKRRYISILDTYDKILLEKEKLFQKTQPNSMDFSAVKVTSSNSINKFDAYVIGLEEKEIDKRLEECKKILEERKKLLRIKERELRESRNPLDKLYLYKFVENLSVIKSCRLLYISQASYYRRLADIEEGLKSVNARTEAENNDIIKEIFSKK